MKTAAIILTTIVINCTPVERPPDMPCEVQEDCDAYDLNACRHGQCEQYIPEECDSHDDCECDEICGDTRTCTVACTADPDCSDVQPWTCIDGLGYCAQPCGEGQPCPDGQACSADGVCWFPPG